MYSVYVFSITDRSQMHWEDWTERNSNKPLRDIKPLKWMLCYSIFSSVVCEKHTLLFKPMTNTCIVLMSNMKQIINSVMNSHHGSTCCINDKHYSICGCNIASVIQARLLLVSFASATVHSRILYWTRVLECLFFNQEVGI